MNKTHIAYVYGNVYFYSDVEVDMRELRRRIENDLNDLYGLNIREYAATTSFPELIKITLNKLIDDRINKLDAFEVEEIDE